MNVAYVSIGGNQGDRLNYLLSVHNHLISSGIQIIQKSKIYESQAWGYEKQDNFLNQVLKITTHKTPEDLLKLILDIEFLMGRERSIKWGPRIIDIDILFFNQEIVKTEDLVIPHPYLHERKFILIPLYEINCELFHPSLNKKVTQLLNECVDELNVVEYIV